MSVASRTFKPNENGVYIDHDGGGAWHPAAAPEDARTRYRDVLQRAPTHGRGPTRVQRIEMGEVVAETFVRGDQD